MLKNKYNNFPPTIHFVYMEHLWPYLFKTC